MCLRSGKSSTDVTNPVREISLDEARQVKPDAQLEEEIEFKKPTVGLGRIAAQMAKQVIFQKVREAERESVYAEYHKHVGEVVNCVVKRFENGDIIVELGKTEGKLGKARSVAARELLRRRPHSRDHHQSRKDGERSAGHRFAHRSRTLVQHLFQTEVPEIYDGTVQIKSIAREAGERTKIAVTSREKDVDPVGACVGMKGTRVQSIIRELRGEKIDIIQWNDDIVTFATNSISPAKISRVSIVDSTDKIMEMVVEDSQLSLAIGKKGQNVRLASKLIGWRIDIKSEEEKRAEVESQMRAVARICSDSAGEHAGPDAGAGLKNSNAAGIETVEQLGESVAGGSGEHSGNRRKNDRENQRRSFGVLQQNCRRIRMQMERLAQQHMFSKDDPARKAGRSRKLRKNRS